MSDLYDAIVRDTARMIAQQDYLGRPIDELMPRAAEIVEQKIRQGILADPRAKYDMSAFIDGMSGWNV